MHSKYDNMHKNEMFYALICINNHLITSINYMLSPSPPSSLSIAITHFLHLPLALTITLSLAKSLLDLFLVLSFSQSLLHLLSANLTISHVHSFPFSLACILSLTLPCSHPSCVNSYSRIPPLSHTLSNGELFLNMNTRVLSEPILLLLLLLLLIHQLDKLSIY